MAFCAHTGKDCKRQKSPVLVPFRVHRACWPLGFLLFVCHSKQRIRDASRKIAGRALHCNKGMMREKSNYLLSAASCTIRDAFWLESSGSHWCSANCLRRLSCASEVRFRDAAGALKVREQAVHTATAGTVVSHLTTRKLRFAMQSVSHSQTCAN